MRQNSERHTKCVKLYMKWINEGKIEENLFNPLFMLYVNIAYLAKAYAIDNSEVAASKLIQKIEDFDNCVESTMLTNWKVQF